MNECENCAICFDGEEDDDLCPSCEGLYMVECFRLDEDIVLPDSAADHSSYSGLARSLVTRLVVFQISE